MNLSKLFEMQKALDEKIELEKPPQPGEDRLAKKILALQVELGELANEWRGFKFWSKDQEANTPEKQAKLYNEGKPDHFRLEPDNFDNPLLEEYVDCLHFILSIGLELGHDAETVRGLEWTISKMFSPIHVVESFSNLMSIANDPTHPTSYKYLVWKFIDIGFKLGFTWEQIEQAYKDKHAINLQRQVNGY